MKYPKLLAKCPSQGLMLSLEQTGKESFRLISQDHTGKACMWLIDDKALLCGLFNRVRPEQAISIAAPISV